MVTRDVCAIIGVFLQIQCWAMAAELDDHQSKSVSHCALIQGDEIQVIVGDATRDGVAGPTRNGIARQQYCGLWSLTSKHYAHNVFGNSYAGLLPYEIRWSEPRLKIVGPQRVELLHAADQEHPVDVCASYEIVGPNIIEHELSFVDKKDMRETGCGFREVKWCSYINSPEDNRFYFLSSGNWVGYNATPLGSAIAPSYISEDQIAKYPIEAYKKEGKEAHFDWYYAPIRFDMPFYYGKCGKMVLIYVFGKPVDWLQFFSSPVGGGMSILPGKRCPAWDFKWVIPARDYHVGKKYSFKVRLIYKLFQDNDDVLRQVRMAQQAMSCQ